MRVTEGIFSRRDANFVNPFLQRERGKIGGCSS
jgi:hypothetical protein